jgi:perosamine synthetase
VIRLNKPVMGLPELLAISKVFRGGWVAGQGPQTMKFEENLAELVGVRYSIAVSNATAGLYIALVALGVKPGDEVIVADYTYPATGHAVLFAGATPIFADVSLDTGNLNPESIEPLITRKTKGVIAVDVGGRCADYEMLNTITKRNNLFLLQDAACSVGATRNGVPSGKNAEISVFSFHGRKGITCGEGGAIVTDSEALHKVATGLVSFGISSALTREKDVKIQIPRFESLGFNFKLSDISCAILNQQLKRLPILLSKREKIAGYYHHFLKDNPMLILPPLEKTSRHSWQTFAIRVDSKSTRDDLISFLRSSGIQSNIGTFASHLQPVYKSLTQCPNSRQLFETQIALPIHPKLKKRHIRQVSKQIEAFFNQEKL